MQPVKIEAIIRPEKFEEVKRSLEEAGYTALTVYEVRGRGEQRGIELEYRGHRIRVELLPKLKLEIVVPSIEDAEKAARIIMEAARTGKPGDGRIFLIPVLKAYKIRTGEETP
ncbi:MAG: P-II family nitrogen regulator [Crenarchaeota archaeon]|nr:P-II family nitrogen regulator [Thermoproteota archaeon]